MNHNELNTVKNVIELLNNLPKRDNLNVDDVLKELDDMRRDTILKQHKENYKVWQAKDGRWKTKLPDGSKYGKLVAKATLENLENFIVDYYKALGEEKENLEAVYPKFIECKYLSSEKGTANKLQWAIVQGLCQNESVNVSLVNSLYIGSFPKRYRSFKIPSL